MAETAPSSEENDGILIVDAEENIVRFNQRFLDIWQIPQQVAERSDNARLISFVLDKLVDPGTFLRVTRENHVDPAREYFCTLRFKDGRVVERFSTPQLHGGEFVGRLLRFRDVTSHCKLLEAAHRFPSGPGGESLAEHGSDLSSEEHR